jgi:negative regulator of flagellin synthesis FlgM
MAIEFDKSHTPLVNPAAGSQTGTRAQEQKPESEPTSRAGGAAGDAVTLTDVSSRIRDLVTQTGREPPLDRNRVEALRDAIAAGTYKVDSNTLAERLLKSEGELFK